MEKTTFLQQIKQKSPRDREKISQAYDLAKKYHHGQKRMTGESYLQHPLRVTIRLLKFTTDTDAIIAAILHDTVEDTPLTLSAIAKQFGKEVAFIVDGATKIEHDDKKKGKKLTLQKIVAYGKKDKRIILLKFADTLDNLDTIHVYTPEKQHELINEVKDTYLPLAKKLKMTPAETAFLFHCKRFERQNKPIS